ncbi:uncharacterized protein LOC134147547 [Rhea pennata]|uniref:uncharacterized protein LOC134147547 n=1 Tax=Rhea pennata TaxID=8795 RepID=UPI002E262D1A
MDFVPALGDPASRPHRRLLQRFNETISPLFVALPGFLRLEVTSIRAPAGPLRRALRLPPRLRLRGRGGRQRPLHLRVPPRLLQEPGHLHAPPGRRARLPVSRRQRLLVRGAALRLPGDAAGPAGHGRRGAARRRPPGRPRRRPRRPPRPGAAAGGHGGPDREQLPAVLPPGRCGSAALVSALARFGQFSGQSCVQQLRRAAPVADPGQRLLQLQGKLGSRHQLQAALASAHRVPAQFPS